MTMTEAARALEVSREHAHRLRSASRLPARQTASGLRVARRADLKSRLRGGASDSKHAGHLVWRERPRGDEINLTIMISASIRGAEVDRTQPPLSVSVALPHQVQRLSRSPS